MEARKNKRSEVFLAMGICRDELLNAQVFCF
ncbi:hypothetical protein MTsPCn9_09310 [Croceitalea sp. MTPC9]|nr:hypothetical protein MTsPCn6_33680 [Croceitalea sp. MTPC6]GMN15995.1 hypothetical protein MTsPCn9_09310 [Croceitalea sp. MTPC9]